MSVDSISSKVAVRMMSKKDIIFLGELEYQKFYNDIKAKKLEWSDEFIKMLHDRVKKRYNKLIR